MLSRIFLLGIAVAAISTAASADELTHLSPATQVELMKLSPAERAALAQQLLGHAPKAANAALAKKRIVSAPPPAAVPTSHRPDGNDFLCTAFGCVGGTLMVGGSAFGAEPQGSYPDNFGWVAGGNLATPIPGLQQYGLGAQFAATYATYDFGGKTSPGSTLDSFTQQGFVSAGLFRRPDPYGPWWSRVGFGVAYDWSDNANAGTFGQQYQLRQWRAKASYDITDAHEVGVWAVWHANTVYCATCALGTPDSIRSMNQVNFFYKYNLPDGGSVSVYYGPGIDHFTTPPSAGFPVAGNYKGLRWTVGGDATLPINDYLAVFTDAAYGRPDTSPSMGVSPTGGYAAAQQAWLVMSGLRFYWGGNAKVRDDTGRHWMPYLPDPNNGSMFQFSNKVE